MKSSNAKLRSDGVSSLRRLKKPEIKSQQLLADSLFDPSLRELVLNKNARKQNQNQYKFVQNEIRSSYMVKSKDPKKRKSLQLKTPVKNPGLIAGDSQSMLMFRPHIPQQNSQLQTNYPNYTTKVNDYISKEVLITDGNRPRMSYLPSSTKPSSSQALQNANLQISELPTILKSNPYLHYDNPTMMNIKSQESKSDLVNHKSMSSVVEPRVQIFNQNSFINNHDTAKLVKQQSNDFILINENSKKVLIQQIAQHQSNAVINNPFTVIKQKQMHLDQENQTNLNNYSGSKSNKSMDNFEDIQKARRTSNVDLVAYDPDLLKKYSLIEPNLIYKQSQSNPSIFFNFTNHGQNSHQILRQQIKVASPKAKSYRIEVLTQPLNYNKNMMVQGQLSSHNRSFDSKLGQTSYSAKDLKENQAIQIIKSKVSNQNQLFEECKDENNIQVEGKQIKNTLPFCKNGGVHTNNRNTVVQSKLRSLRLSKQEIQCSHSSSSIQTIIGEDAHLLYHLLEGDNINKSDLDNINKSDLVNTLKRNEERSFNENQKLQDDTNQEYFSNISTQNLKNKFGISDKRLLSSTVRNNYIMPNHARCNQSEMSNISRNKFSNRLMEKENNTVLESIQTRSNQRSPTKNKTPELNSDLPVAFRNHSSASPTKRNDYTRQHTKQTVLSKEHQGSQTNQKRTETLMQDNDIELIMVPKSKLRVLCKYHSIENIKNHKQSRMQPFINSMSSQKVNESGNVEEFNQEFNQPFPSQQELIQQQVEEAYKKQVNEYLVKVQEEQSQVKNFNRLKGGKPFQGTRYQISRRNTSQQLKQQASYLRVQVLKDYANMKQISSQHQAAAQIQPVYICVNGERRVVNYKSPTYTELKSPPSIQQIKKRKLHRPKSQIPHNQKNNIIIIKSAHGNSQNQTQHNQSVHQTVVKNIDFVRKSENGVSVQDLGFQGENDQLRMQEMKKEMLNRYMILKISKSMTSLAKAKSRPYNTDIMTPQFHYRKNFFNDNFESNEPANLNDFLKLKVNKKQIKKQKLNVVVFNQYAMIPESSVTMVSSLGQEGQDHLRRGIKDQIHTQQLTSQHTQQLAQQLPQHPNQHNAMKLDFETSKYFLQTLNNQSHGSSSQFNNKNSFSFNVNHQKGSSQGKKGGEIQSSLEFTYNNSQQKTEIRKDKTEDNNTTFERDNDGEVINKLTLLNPNKPFSKKIFFSESGSPILNKQNTSINPPVSNMLTSNEAYETEGIKYDHQGDREHVATNSQKGFRLQSERVNDSQSPGSGNNRRSVFVRESAYGSYERKNKNQDVDIIIHNKDEIKMNKTPRSKLQNSRKKPSPGKITSSINIDQSIDKKTKEHIIKKILKTTSSDNDLNQFINSKNGVIIEVQQPANETSLPDTSQQQSGFQLQNFSKKLDKSYKTITRNNQVGNKDICSVTSQVKITNKQNKNQQEFEMQYQKNDRNINNTTQILSQERQFMTKQHSKNDRESMMNTKRYQFAVLSSSNNRDGSANRSTTRRNLQPKMVEFEDIHYNVFNDQRMKNLLSTNEIQSNVKAGAFQVVDNYELILKKAQHENTDVSLTKPPLRSSFLRRSLNHQPKRIIRPDRSLPHPENYTIKTAPQRSPTQQKTKKLNQSFMKQLVKK